VVAIPTNSDECAHPNLPTIQVCQVCADDHPVMANLYFCQPHAQNQGMLRAVLSLADCNRLVAFCPAKYLGDHFPKVYEEGGQTRDFAIVGVSAAEASSEWPCGYYRVDADLVELNTQLLAL
jgi:hypothetical protein